MGNGSEGRRLLFEDTEDGAAVLHLPDSVGVEANRTDFLQGGRGGGVDDGAWLHSPSVAHGPAFCALRSHPCSRVRIPVCYTLGKNLSSEIEKNAFGGLSLWFCPIAFKTEL